MNSSIFFSKSIVFRKLMSDDIASIDSLYNIFSNSKSIEDLKKYSDKIIVGTIKKAYKYDAKRYIDNQNVSGKQEYKFFKFVIKEELNGYIIACHYEGQFGAFSILRDILKANEKHFDVFLIYKKYKDVQLSDLRKIEYISSKYTKESTSFGIFKKKKEEVRELTLNNSSKEQVSRDKLYELLSLPNSENEDEDEKTVALYIILKNGKKINILDAKNTHFSMENIEYVNNLPKEDLFVGKVNEIILRDF